MPISKPSTWENGFKNSPQAETTQLRAMGLYLNPQGKFEPLDNSWNNILNNSPTLFDPDETFMGKGIYMTPKGIGIGIDPMSPELGFGGTYGILVEQDVLVYRADDNARAARVTVGNYNRPLPGGTNTGVQATWTYDFLGEQAELFVYDHDVTKYRQMRLEGNPLLINAAFDAHFTGSRKPIMALINGNFVIGGLTLGTNTTADNVLGISDGTAPNDNIGGIQIYSLDGNAHIEGWNGTGTGVRNTISWAAGNSLYWEGGTNGNVAIGGTTFGTHAARNLVLYDGTGAGVTDGVAIFSDSGAAKVVGGSGTVTTFGAADPHCQRCDRDFALEWENEKYGKLAICVWCLSEKFDDIVIEKYEGGN
jgi:hypothetical protein